MIVKTKKYQLSTGKYIKLGLINIFRAQWWVVLIALAIAAMTFVIPSHWWWIGALIALVIYGLFWLIQFAGITQLEQNKILFERLNYEISSHQILIKLNPKQGMPMKWETIKKVQAGKDFYLLVISKAQFIYLPYRIFNSENDRKFMETILRRKNYIK
ncbi:MAG: YcxB family protein [Cyclobacteriaceae bacterium]|nr:YcxB family protein [Cyclobacteriaceae bacterium]